MGEDYLNSLLKGGLLAVPNVDVPEEDLQFKIDRSVTPSAKRAFVFLFTLLFLATAGGVTWYVYSEKQKTADVDRRVDTALQLAQSGSYQDLDKALAEATAAMERDDKSEQATSTFAMVGALNSLLYKLDPTKAEFATTGARKYVESGEAGDRELLIAEAAIKLARLPEMERPRDELASLRKKLEAALAAGEDGWLRWLQGRSMLAAGERDAAAKAFRQAEETPQAPLVATIDRADLLLDDGKFEEARKLYEDVLGKSENHPLAVIGLSLLRAETSKELAQAVDDLNVRLTRVESPRVDAYENLAFAYARYALQDYGDFRKHLDQAIGLSEPRFWARVGLLRLRAGLIKEAGAARQRMQWYGPENAVRDPDPLVEMLDAELSLTLGRPKAALSKIGKVDGLRGLSLRARAHFDRGEYTEAVAELDKALAIAADDRELKAFREAARALSGSSKERREAMKELADIRLNSKSKVPSYLEGLVYLSRGKLDDARYALDKSVENISEEEPNRLAYRSHLALAEVYYRKGDIDKAVADINRALEINQVYLPTLVLLGKIELGRQDWAAAADAFGQVVAADEENAADWKVELGYAEALIKNGGDKLSADDRKLAVASLEKAKEKGADGTELGRVAALLGDEELMTRLGVEAPDDKKRR